MSLPRFIVLKSNYNHKYLGYVLPKEFSDIDEGVERSRNSFLRFDWDEISTTYNKFEVEPAKTGSGLVHLKSCHNNKYWVRWSTSHYWIVAAADQPEEDRNNWYCTLFKPIYVDRNANTVRFIHIQLGHYVCLWRIGLPFGNCLFGGSIDRDKDSCDVFTVIDWESLASTSSVVDQENKIPVSRTRNSLNATASLKGGDFDVKGTIAFTQRDLKSVTIIPNIRSFPSQCHTLCIKTYGDISLGSFSSEPTFCDLGNFRSDGRGVLQGRKTSNEISLRGVDSILGRTIVVYSEANPDDDDVPVAWGVIGYGF